MNKIFRYLSLVLIAIFVITTVSTMATAKAPVPIDYWALRDTVSAVSVSPDGKHILVMKIESKEGEHILEIYDTSDFSKPLRRLNADPMEIISARWISDNFIFGNAWKIVRKSVKGPNEDVRSYRSFSYNLEENKFSNISGNFGIVSTLPKEPEKILITRGNAVGGGLGVDPFAAFRPQSYYKFDLNTGAKSLVIKGSEKYNGIQFDIDGNPRFAQGYDAGSHTQKMYYRALGEKSWTQYGKTYDLDLHENLYRVLGGFQGFQGVSAENPNVGYFIETADGEDKASLFEFDFLTGKLGKKLFSTPDADVMGIQRSSMSAAGDNRIVAALYPGAKRERHWFDETEKALYKQFEDNIPNAHQISVSSRSRDGQTMVVTNRGPKDPGSFWYVQDGKMAFLGSRNGLLKPEDLSNVEYIRYKARDGQVVPAYLTTPNSGSAPYPLIVLPHGGPHVNEVISYDEWGQLLANNGYMVLQPQYRMSVGWGKKHFDSAFGEHGYAMQDDKDDGALYLVDKGLVDIDRIAMFGWSYGGYAALVAATRENNIYQCAIAGAAVADPKKSYLRGRGSNIKALNEWARARGGFVGINPIKEIDKINIPVMMVHGDMDQRVEYFHYKDYRKEIKRVASTREVGSCSGGISNTNCTTTMYKNSKSKGDSTVSLPSGGGQNTYVGKIRFVSLKGADHFYATLMYRHQKKFYTEMLDFLQNDCGPGGL